MLYFLSSGDSDILDFRYFFHEYSILDDRNTYVYDRNADKGGK